MIGKPVLFASLSLIELRTATRAGVGTEIVSLLQVKFDFEDISYCQILVRLEIQAEM